MFQFDQTNLGLSTREHFLKEQNRAYRDAYKRYMSRVAVLLGADPHTANVDADLIVAFETALANVMFTSYLYNL